MYLLEVLQDNIFVQGHAHKFINYTTAQHSSIYYRLLFVMSESSSFRKKPTKTNQIYFLRIAINWECQILVVER